MIFELNRKLFILRRIYEIILMVELYNTAEKYGWHSLFSVVRLMARHVQMTAYRWKLLTLVAVLHLMVEKIYNSKVPNQVNHAAYPKRQRPHGRYLNESLDLT